LFLLKVDPGKLEDGEAELYAGAVVVPGQGPAIAVVHRSVRLDTGAAGIGIGP